MASPDLNKNAARWLVGYFSLIDVSEAWIIGHVLITHILHEYLYVSYVVRLLLYFIKYFSEAFVIEHLNKQTWEWKIIN